MPGLPLGTRVPVRSFRHVFVMLLLLQLMMMMMMAVGPGIIGVIITDE